MEDKDGGKVADGVYRICLELTNGNAKQNKFHRATFSVNKNGVASRQENVTEGGYNSVTVEYIP